MKKLIMFLSVLGMVSVGSVYAEGQSESEKCVQVHADDRSAGPKVEGSSTTTNEPSAGVEVQGNK